MTWLSKIERQLSAGWSTSWGNDKRMARVIRELADVAKHCREHVMCVEWDKHRGYLYEFDEIHSNLSPDAKEVIDDTTSPSST